jgi:hypothetical protein
VVLASVGTDRTDGPTGKCCLCIHKIDNELTLYVNTCLLASRSAGDDLDLVFVGSWVMRMNKLSSNMAMQQPSEKQS